MFFSSLNPTKSPNITVQRQQATHRAPLLIEMYLPPASAPPSWSHLCEQAEQAHSHTACVQRSQAVVAWQP